MSNFCEMHRQRGSIMLEALIGVALTGVIGAGTMHMAARIATGQHELRTHAAVVADLREQLNDGGASLCNSNDHTVSLPGGRTVAAAVSCVGAPAVLVTPAIVAGGTVPGSRAVPGMQSVFGAVELRNAGVQANEPTAALRMGTR